MSKCPEKECSMRGLSASLSPAHYAAKGNLTLVKTTVYPEEYHAVYQVKCKKCEKSFWVKDETAYHSPVYYYPEGL